MLRQQRQNKYIKKKRDNFLSQYLLETENKDEFSLYVLDTETYV